MMPVDKMFVDPMLQVFRDMAAEMKKQKHSGEAFDKMIAALDRMETLAVECNDLNEFNAKLIQEGLQAKFSMHYGEVMSQAAEKSSKAGGYDDNTLMQNTLRAYEDAITRIEEAEKVQFENITDDVRKIKPSIRIVPVLRKIIEFGKSGVSYPEFLTKMIVEGWEKAMEGVIVVRDGIEFEIEFSKDTGMIPPYIEMHEERLKAFDEMAKKSAFGLPDSLLFSLKSQEIEHKYKPIIAKWEAIEQRWMKILELLLDWLDAYCSFAPYDGRWRTPGCSEAQVQKNIRRTKGCNPGILKQRERILFESFGMKWDDIFKHETFKFRHSSLIFPYSEERFELIKKTYPYCQPKGKPVVVEEPPKELIAEAEKLHSEKKVVNPNLKIAAENAKKIYDKYNGEGAYEKNFGK